MIFTICEPNPGLALRFARAQQFERLTTVERALRFS
jgi:hypothetical protein